MKRALLAGGGLLALSLILSLGGCASRHAETIRRVKALMEQRQFVPALNELTDAIRQDPNDKQLKRLRVMLLIGYERLDMAYGAYMELLKISAHDQVLVEALRDNDPTVRLGAARVLGFVGKDQGLEGLLRLVTDKDREVRRAAVTALGEIRAVRAVPPLIGALKDEWWFVRSEAAEALGKIRDVSAAAPLFELLGDSDSSVRLSAENALLTISRLANSPADVYKKNAFDPNANSDARRVALLALSVLKDYAALEPLLELVSDEDPRKRAQAIRALGILQDASALPAIRKALGDSHAMVRLQAVEALGACRDAGAVGQLKAISTNPTEQPIVRQSSVMALVKISEAPPQPAAPTSTPTP